MLGFSDLLNLFLSLIAFGIVLFLSLMSKSKEPKEKQTKIEQAKATLRSPTKIIWTPVRKIMTLTLGAATLIGGVPAAIFFWPRMTVTPSGLFDESNAYSEIFTVTNTGYLPFEDVHMGLGICSIETVKKDFFVTGNNCDETGPYLMFTGASWYTPELVRDQPFQVVLTDALNLATDKYRAEHPKTVLGTQMMSPLKAMNAIFRVSFMPWPWPKYIAFRYRFVAEEQPNGKMLWRAVPLAWREIKLPQ
jgi:hypothetical protein